MSAVRRRSRGGGVRDGAEGVDADEVDGGQRDDRGRHVREASGRYGKGVAVAAGVGLGSGVTVAWVGEEAVDDEALVGQAERGELASGAGGFGERGARGAGDENRGRGGGVGEHGNGALVEGLLSWSPASGPRQVVGSGLAAT